MDIGAVNTQETLLSFSLSINFGNDKLLKTISRDVPIQKVTFFFEPSLQLTRPLLFHQKVVRILKKLVLGHEAIGLLPRLGIDLHLARKIVYFAECT